MSSATGSFEDQFRSTPRLLVQMLDAAQDRVLLALMSEDDYRQASFLDQRILGGNRLCEWVPWSRVEGLGQADSARFIFHIGHVGSTLLSRLLGELPGVFALREPQILRDLAELSRLRNRPQSPWPPDRFEPRLSVALEWLSRTFRPNQRSIVKASSFASDLAALVQRPKRRSLFLYASPEAYLETILAGESSRQELAVLSGDRLTRLHGRLSCEPWTLWQLGLGERAALAWACEMTALSSAAAAAPPDAVLWVNFDRFLADSHRQLHEVAKFFGEPLDDGLAAALLGGPIMRSYSKAPEQAYSPRVRHDTLARARLEHGGELRAGMAWLDAAGRQHPAIAETLARAGRA